ncbi:MAG: zinc-binding dehydrogenase [Bacteroidota bacterium]
MHALILQKADQPLSYDSCDTPSPQEGQSLIRIHAAALNHRDVWITKGMYPGIVYPCILGSDGAGTTPDGREVIINPSLNWGDNPRAQGADYHILGLPSQGTFAEQLAIGDDKLVDKPGHLTFQQAAALPLAGLTAYRALFSRAQLQSGERVLISGVGGGVALFACQFALAAGAEVWVTSGSEEKIAKAVDMGAKGGMNYKTAKWGKALKAQSGLFDVVIDSGGGDGFGELVRLCAPGGRIAFYGGTRGNFPALSPQLLFWKQISLLGSTMGNDQEFADMVAFVEKHKIVPVVDSVFPIADGNAAFQRMDDGLQFGKIVLELV